MECNKEKSPAFQFYPKDFLSDTDAMAMPTDVRGIYIALLCYDWINDGLPQKSDLWLRLGGYDDTYMNGEPRPPGDINVILSWLDPLFIKHPSKKGYVTNKRLYRERMKQEERSKKASESAAMRWHKDRISESDAKRCSSSSIASSSSSSNNKRHIVHPEKPSVPSARPPKGHLTDDDFVKALESNQAYKGINIRKELAKMDAWFLTPKGRGRQKTRAFVVNWLNKCDARMGGTHESGTDRIKRIAETARQRQQGIPGDTEGADPTR